MGPATITINTDAISNDFLEGLKRMYPHKDIEISVRLSDATEEIRCNPAYAEELKRRIATLDDPGKLMLVNPNDLLCGI